MQALLSFEYTLCPLNFSISLGGSWFLTALLMLQMRKARHVVPSLVRSQEAAQLGAQSGATSGLLTLAGQSKPFLDPDVTPRGTGPAFQSWGLSVGACRVEWG